MRDPSNGVEATPRAQRPTRPTRPPRRSLAVAAGLAAMFIIYTWLVVSWSPFIRLDEQLNRNFHVQSFWPVLARIDVIGQASPLNWHWGRAICLPLLGLIAAATGWRIRSFRPLVLALLAVGLENMLVSIPKFTMDRGRPLSGDSFFSNGDLYPSGHSANMVAYYGLCYYLISHYGQASERVRRWLLNVVVALTAIMFATSLLMRWHWFSDLVGGLMVGGVALALTIGIDSVLPNRRGPRTDTSAAERAATAEVERRPAMARTDHQTTRSFSSSGPAAVDERPAGS